MSDNKDRFNKKISSMTLQGWSIVDRNDSNLECVLEKKGKETSKIRKGKNRKERKGKERRDKREERRERREERREKGDE